MNIESNSAQIIVRDTRGTSGVNVNPAIGGYAAELWFWGGSAYLCKRKDDSFIRVLVVPGPHWLNDIKQGGYEVVGILSELDSPQNNPTPKPSP